MKVFGRYPFSVTLWNSRDLEAMSCRAIFLSPLHPIRMYWLAANEKNLRSASNAEYFSGTIEGWNFPAVGKSDQIGTVMTALPGEAGLEQLFLGWSILAPAQGNFGQLGIPNIATGIKIPGVSVTGLNRGAVINALLDFRRIHPFLPSLTIDLAARGKGGRVEEIDHAIIEQIQTWSEETKRREVRLHGVRIYDSLNREGDISEVHDKGAESGIPFSGNDMNKA